MGAKVPLFHFSVLSLTYEGSQSGRRPSKERTVNKNAKSSLSLLGASLFVLSLSVGCGSVGSQTPSDGGPNSGSGGNGSGGNGNGGLTGSAGAGGGNTGGTTGAAGTPVNLRTAGNYVILAESGISTVPPAVVTGDLGVYPMMATAITNFSLTADITNVFATSMQVKGKVYAAGYAAPTPANLLAAIGDMGLAYMDAAGRAPDVTELGAGSIGGMTLAPGVYKWGTGVLIPTDLTLNGSSTAVWIFQIAQTLTLSSAVNVHLTGGALAKNVFWQVATSVELGTTSHIEGIVLSGTMINLRTGASIAGRLMAQTAVTLDTSTVTEPAL
jgi:Ice-binding-like